MTQAVIIDDHPANTNRLLKPIECAGIEVTFRVRYQPGFLARLANVEADLILFVTDIPHRGMFEDFTNLSKFARLPIILFSRIDDGKLITQSIRAGVTSYVYGDVELERLRSIVNVAIARHKETSRLNKTIENHQVKLKQRATVERAKGILMQMKNINEEDAYVSLRTLAMSENKTIGDIADRVIRKWGTE
jgi:response regulator NasT